MKKFNTFSEAILVTLHPKSDAVAPVEACPCQQRDMLTQTADDVLKNLGGDVVQPDDGIGQSGDIQADGIGEYAEDGSEGTDGDVELECTGDGLRVKFNGIEIVLPKNVVEKIKSHEEHEDTETPAEEEAEHTEDGSETEDEDNTETTEEPEDNTVTESKKSKKTKKWTPPWLKNKDKDDDKKDSDKKSGCNCKGKFGKAKK